MVIDMVPNWLLIVGSTLGLTEIRRNYINVGLYGLVLPIVSMRLFVRDLIRHELG